MAGIEVVLRADTTIGESPTWSAEEGALYFIDVKAPALFRLDPDSGRLDRWSVGADIGGFALLPESGGALVALRSGLHRLDFATSGTDLIAPPPFDPAMHRFNEGGCDPAGRFWVGVMFDPADPASPPLKGALHSYTRAGGLRQEPDLAELHNGMAWSAEGTRMFLSHSNRRTIHHFAYAGGRIGDKALFATIPEADGLPDGAAIDTAGGYWCALHGGGGLRRFHPDGSVDRTIGLPVSQPTMCCFAGPDLTDLYVTTATDKLTADQRRQEPLAGALLRLRPGERGIPRRCTLA
jgi:sugar lactone lactonase YvrE